MAIWATMGAGARAAVMAAGTAVAGGVGWLVWEATRPSPVPPAATPAALAVVPEPVSPEAAAPDAAPETVAPEETAEIEALAPVAPVIGTWAVTADGSATVAGMAEPGSLVRILVDGTAVAETRATSGGEFAVVTRLAPNPAPSLMTLVMVLEDGTEIPSSEGVALGPIAGPAVAPAADAAPADAAPPEAPAALLVSDEGATVLQEPAPTPEVAAPENPAAEPAPVVAQAVAGVVVETITYTPGGAVQLGGSGQPGAFLRIYLDNVHLQEVLIPDSGKWLTTLKETPPAIYTLRVDQIDDAGNVTARFETPFRRETREALAAATTAPATAPAPAAMPEAAEPTAAASAPVAEVSPAPPAPEAVAAAPAAAESPAQPAASVPPNATVTAAEPAAAPAVAAAEAPPAPAPAASAEAAPNLPATGAEPASVAAATAPEAAPAPAPVTITVQPGHTLWAIAKGELGDGLLYVQVFEANKDKIRDPNLIYPGQIFAIPGR